MKINVLKRLLVFSAIVFFLLNILIIGASLVLRAPAWNLPFFTATLFGIYILLLAFAAYTLFNAGIWIAHSLPTAIKYNRWPWLKWAIAGLVIASLSLALGQMSWMPLIWHGFALPAMFSISLFMVLWGLIAPLLSWSSNIQFSRLTALLLIAPIMALLPLTSFFVSKSLVTSYFKSFPGTYRYVVDSIPDIVEDADPVENVEKSPAYMDANYEVVTSLKAIKQAVLTGNSCAEKKKEVYSLLEKTTPDEQLFWAIKGVRCANFNSAVSFPKLIKLMVEHPNPIIRASAIHAISRYANEPVKSVSYLIVKRIQEKESAEVIEAASMVLKRLGGNEERAAMNRLKSLLTSNQSLAIGKLLMTQFQAKAEVTDFVSANLSGNSQNRHAAIDLICELPKEDISSLASKVDYVIKDLSNDNRKVQTMKAIGCLGDVAFQAIRAEVMQPKQLPRLVAIKAFSKIRSEFGNEYLETLRTCVGDSQVEVRRWCAKSIGQVGAKALPMILDLLKADTSSLRETGQIALAYLNDPTVISELESLRDKNSGWLATQQNLKIAESIQIALAKIEHSNQTK